MQSKLSEDVKGRKDDAGKLRYDLLPWEVLEQVVKVLTFGANKYADNNWKFVPDAKARYEAVMLRHFSAYKQGEYNDKESGLPHLSHAITCLIFKLYLELDEKEKLHDYRIVELSQPLSCKGCLYRNDLLNLCRNSEICVKNSEYVSMEVV